MPWHVRFAMRAGRSVIDGRERNIRACAVSGVLIRNDIPRRKLRVRANFAKIRKARGAATIRPGDTVLEVPGGGMDALPPRHWRRGVRVRTGHGPGGDKRESPACSLLSRKETQRQKRV